MQGACKRHEEIRQPCKGLADLLKWDGTKYKGLANVTKSVGGFAKGLRLSPRTSADLQRACKGHDEFLHPRKWLARNPTEVLSLASDLREPRRENGTQIYEQLKYWEL